jgi:hypothetical protein
VADIAQDLSQLGPERDHGQEIPPPQAGISPLLAVMHDALPPTGLVRRLDGSGLGSECSQRGCYVVAQIDFFGPSRNFSAQFGHGDRNWRCFNGVQ